MSEAVNKSLRAAGDRAKGLAAVFQGFKDFISRGNAIELAVASSSARPSAPWSPRSRTA